MIRALLRALSDPGFLISGSHVITGANEAAAEMLGLKSAGQVEGQSLHSFVSTEPVLVRRYLESCARTRQSVPGALTWKRFDGAEVETRCDGALVEAASGAENAIVYIRCRPRQESAAQFLALNDKIRALSLEIQERRRMEAALHVSEARYRTLVSTTSAVVWIADAAGALTPNQSSWEEFTGQSAEQYRRWGHLEAIHPDDRARVGRHWLECVENGRVFECELRLWHARSGTYHRCHSHAAFLRDRLGKIHEWIGTIGDIEDRRKLDEQMRQTQKLESLGVLAGGVAHDFNNLLVGILGNASMALENIPKGNPSHEMLRDVVSAGEAAAHLTRQLLAYAGKGRFVIEPVDLSEVIRQVQPLIHASIPKLVRLRLELGRDLPCVDADLGQVQQLLMNLIINAAEAIGPERSGSVVVTTSREEVDEHYIQTAMLPAEITPGTYLKLEVQDNGSGMTAETIAKIFDPFFTTKFTGRGLGLAAVLGIVRGHKGALKVYSTPEVGTTFKVLLPAAEGSAVAKAAPLRAGAGNSATILVIDDEAMVRRTATAMLERLGFTVLTAENGREGLDVFRSLHQEIGLVLLDMTMPVMGGEETFRELRTIHPDVRVLLSSGHNEVEAIRHFTGKGLAGFLQKPYSSSTLANSVRAILAGDPARQSD